MTAKEKEKARKARFYVENKERVLERNRAYFAANADEQNAKGRARHAADLEANKARGRASYHRNKEANREKMKAKDAAWSALPFDHPRKVKARETSKRYRDNNRQKLAGYTRKHKLKREYGLTPDAFNAMMLAQNSVCAVCLTDQWGARGPCVDHDHSTGKVRGILCNRCNIGLGQFKDDAERMRAAIAYLERTA